MTRKLSRRCFLRSVLASATAPLFVPANALGLGNRPAPSNRLVFGSIGVGGRGAGNTRTLCGFSEVQMVAVCDVRQDKRNAAKAAVDKHYGNRDCVAVNDFREITRRTDIDAVLIGTPDHWHVPIAIDAMRHGKDVFCENRRRSPSAKARNLSRWSSRPVASIPAAASVSGATTTGSTKWCAEAPSAT